MNLRFALAPALETVRSRRRSLWPSLRRWLRGSTSWFHRRQAFIALVIVGAGLFSGPAGAVVKKGWSQVVLPGSASYMKLYVPPEIDQQTPAPLIVFLHGAGGAPHHYESYLLSAARDLGAVLALPKSKTDVGWGGTGDREVVFEALAVTQALLPIDPERVSMAGHSAGGAYGYLLVYGLAGPWNAVFSMSAPFVHIPALADPSYVPPIRHYYGLDDPNYKQARPLLVAQWQRLGVAFHEDLQAGYGHSTWPASSISDGFSFLVGIRRIAPPEPEDPEDPEEPEDPDDPAPPIAEACTNETRLCLLGDRFVAEVEWHDFVGGFGPGHVVTQTSSDSGLFWFFAPQNWELLVKMVDGCSYNGYVWLFSAATTNVEYTLRVAEYADPVSSGGPPIKVREFHNESGVLSPAFADVQAFASCP